MMNVVLLEERGCSTGQKLIRYDINAIKPSRITIEEEGFYEIRISVEVLIREGLKRIREGTLNNI